MLREVLIVDDDQEMLYSLKEGLEKYDETFTILMAGDGLAAIDKLKQNQVSLVVTDLKMPRMDGFSLLAHIMEHFPDIPVIVITAYGTPEMEKLAHSEGAVGYIEKPFLVEDLAKKIMLTMRKEADGGTLHGVSSGMFLQLIEMEQKTCTIRLADRASGKKGVLFFKEGELMDARVNELQGVQAAYEIFSWDEVSLSIQNGCSVKDKKINVELQAVLLEAMRLKDESSQPDHVEKAKPDVKETKAAKKRPEKKPEKKAQAKTVPQKKDKKKTDSIYIRGKLEKELGDRYGVRDIYQSKDWDGFLAQVYRLGGLFGAGTLKVAHLERGNADDLVLLPGETTTLIFPDPRAPKDRIMTILSQ
jgi:CheY-like chemotaxis protein